MVTVFRAHGLRFIIFSDDHEPAHVHIFGDGHIKINLGGQTGKPVLVQVENMKRSDIRRAMTIATEQQDYLLKRWKEIHG